MILYFPQDTPIERGPTRLIPGTQLHACLHESDHPFAFIADGIKAGTCLLIAFDIGHAAFSNLTDSSRYMFKFVFMRRRNPVAPSWRGGEGAWQLPQARLSKFDHSKAWSYIWDWMRGAAHYTSSNPAGSTEVQRLIGLLNGLDHEARLEAIYTLAEMGADAIGPVQDSLLQWAGLGRELGVRYHRDDTGAFVPERDPYERRWNEIACVPQDEAYALGAMGEVAVQPLIALLKHDDPWIKINAAFALGEIGAPAACAMADLADLLGHEFHQVARTSLDAMAFIGTNTRVALPAIRKLLTVHNPHWQEPTQRQGWTGENQARFNASCALLNSDILVDELEDLLVASLDDTNGYVQALALEALTREGTGEDRQGLRCALDYLKTHRWDDTLANDYRVS